MGTSQKFIGSWELQEWSAQLADGRAVFPYAKDAIGKIMYDQEGNMSVQIMKNNMPLFESDDPLQAKQDEAIINSEGFIAYCGTYEVTHNPDQVIHQIKISSFPNWVNQDQARYYQFKDDQLILSTDVIGSSKHKLIWKKSH